jgi:exodeoxyribonuclease VII small subunit
MTDEPERAYEEIVEDLETVLTQLEDGGLPLDQALDAYEQGVKLSQQAQQLLADAELRIDTLRNETNDPF